MDVAGGRALLRSTGWLSRTPSHFQDTILAAAIWKRQEADTGIGIAGDEIGPIWGLAEGQLDVVNGMVTPDSPTADIDLPGTWGGFAPLFGAARRANTVARTPVLMATVAYDVIGSMLREHPAWWEYIGWLPYERSERWGGGLADLLIRDGIQRCAAVLLRLANCRHRESGNGPAYSLVVTQDDFAAMVNLSRATAGAALRELENRNLIRLVYRGIVLQDAAAMRAMLET